MEWVEADSSWIGRYGYDSTAKELHVTMSNGTGTYVHSHVPKYVFEEMKKAKSVGSIYTAMVKHKYDHRLVERVRG